MPKAIVYIAVIISIRLHAQQLLFNNMSTSLPLPAQECYNIMQDSKGYIWFSTEAGLCKYNGNNLTVFDKRNGLPEGSVYSVKEDNQGVLWMCTSKNRILQIKDGELKEAPCSKYIEGKLKGTLELCYLINFNNNNETYINSGARTFVVSDSLIRETGKADTSAHFYFVKDNGLVPINGGGDQGLRSSTHKANSGFVKIVIATGNSAKEIKHPFEKNKYPYWRVLTARCGKYDFFSYENLLFKVNEDLTYSYYEFPDRVQQLYCDMDNGLWVGLRKNGVYYYPNVQSMKDPLINLKEYSVSGICEDHEKGIWCTTLEKGIFYCRNKQIVSYANVNGMNKRGTLLKNCRGTVYGSSEDNVLLRFTGNEVKKQQLPGNEALALKDIFQFKNDCYLATSGSLYRTDGDLKARTDILLGGTKFSAGAYEIVNVGERLFVVQYSVLSELERNEAILRTALPEAGKCLLNIDENKLLCGCKNGLYEFEIKNYSLKRIEGIKGEVTRIIKRRNGKVWVSSKDEGVYVYENGKLRQLPETLQLNNARFFDLFEDTTGTIWLAGNIGLTKVYTVSGVYKSETYGVLNGLPSGEVYKVTGDNKNIYFLTNEGFCSFSLNSSLNNEGDPRIYIEKIFVNGTALNTLEKAELEYNENNLTLSFAALTFKGSNDKLFYSLNGEKAVSINGAKLELNNLNAGSYNLKVFATNNSGVLSKTPLVINFAIARPFWWQAWFIVLCAIVLGGIIYLVVKAIVKNIRHKEEEKTQINKLIAESQLSALQAQMNPHFIFNAINSIQGYVLKKDPQLAYDYLAKFSKLIRMVLNHSQEKTLPLKQELEMLQLYIELEQLRFEKSFSFRLEIDKNVDPFEVQVPGMMIQPYVENAIWHGLMNLNGDRRGELKINIYEEGELIKVIVEDNGVGREQAKTFKKDNGHTSVAMKLNEQRLVMINTLQDYAGAKVLVSDLCNEGKAMGTRVEIFIPYN